MHACRRSAGFATSTSSGRHVADNTHQWANPPPGHPGSLFMPVSLPGTLVPVYPCMSESHSPTAGSNPGKSLYGTAVPSPSFLTAQVMAGSPPHHGPHSNFSIRRVTCIEHLLYVTHFSNYFCTALTLPSFTTALRGPITAPTLKMEKPKQRGPTAGDEWKPPYTGTPKMPDGCPNAHHEKD